MKNAPDFGKDKIGNILMRLAPPVMAAQLIQALYNIVDSLFVGHDTQAGLTALSIVYPLQLLMIAIAVGTGVGINTVMASKLGVGDKKASDEYAGVGTPLALILWAVFAAVCYFVMPAYARISTDSPEVIEDVIVYGRIVGVCGIGLFTEGVWSKILQAEGDMKTPMVAQICGAVTNIVLDPLLIFGMFGLPRMGIAGAAVATVVGQVVAALVVMRRGMRRPPVLQKFLRYVRTVFRLGIPNILMQSAYTFYIFGLNLILAGFSDAAVTVLGLYYKWQTFFFIPLGAMQTCIVPVISYNYAARNTDRCRRTLFDSVIFGMALMFLGTLCFSFLPEQMLRVFSSEQAVISIGIPAFRIISISFIPLVTSLIFPVFFQAVGFALKSSALTVIRTVVLFVPLGYLFSRFGLNYFWLTYPVTEVVTTAVGVIMYRRFLRHPYLARRERGAAETPVAIQPSVPGVIITIARKHGSSGKEIGRLVAQQLGIPFYYKEMTALAAQESGLDREFISGINRNSPKRLHDLYLSTHVVRHAIEAQDKIIRRIAQNGSCVIVGRAADYVLRDEKDLVRVFVYAPQEYRIGRLMEVYGDSREEAERNIKRSDSARAAYYRTISGNEWGDRAHYDLMVNSSVGVEESADLICAFLRSRVADDSPSVHA